MNAQQTGGDWIDEACQKDYDAGWWWWWWSCFDVCPYVSSVYWHLALVIFFPCVKTDLSKEMNLVLSPTCNFFILTFKGLLLLLLLHKADAQKDLFFLKKTKENKETSFFLSRLLKMILSCLESQVDRQPACRNILGSSVIITRDVYFFSRCCCFCCAVRWITNVMDFFFQMKKCHLISCVCIV